jgi:hypothetical protein
MIEQTVEDLMPLVGPAQRAVRWAPRQRRSTADAIRWSPGRPVHGSSRRGRCQSPSAKPSWPELHSERFVDCSPAQVWATLLDEGPLSRLGAHVLPAARGSSWWRAGATQAAHAHGLHQAGTARTAPERAVELGYREAETDRRRTTHVVDPLPERVRLAGAPGELRVLSSRCRGGRRRLVRPP